MQDLDDYFQCFFPGSICLAGLSMPLMKRIHSLLCLAGEKKAFDELKSTVIARMAAEKRILGKFENDKTHLKAASKSKDRVLEIQAQLKRFDEISQSLNQHKKDFDGLEEEDNNLKSDIEALNPCICILKEVEKLSNEINDFALNSSKFSSDIDLYKVVVHLNKGLAKLEDMLDH